MITLWFPKAIYFQPNILNDKLDLYEREIKNALSEVGSLRDGAKNVNSTHRLQTNLFDVCNLDELRREFFDRSKYFLNELGYNNIQSLHFDNCWANISYPGDYIFPHNHNGSMISGVYYIKSSLHEKIKFFNSPTMHSDPDIWNNLNHQHCEYTCVPGSMLIFMSDLMHGTEKQHCEEKISISFNMSL